VKELWYPLNMRLDGPESCHEILEKRKTSYPCQNLNAGPFKTHSPVIIPTTLPQLHTHIKQQETL